jgi:hypothetical protein
MSRMLGGIVMAVILVLVFPVAFLIGMALLASGLGSVLKRDSDVRNAGTELFEVSEADLYQRRN